MPLNVNTSKQLTPAPPTTSMVSDRARRCVRVGNATSSGNP